MKKTLLIITALITLCSFGNNKHHKLQRRQGVLIQTNKGVEFVPMGDWQDYTPKPFGDTCWQFRTV